MRNNKNKTTKKNKIITQKQKTQNTHARARAHTHAHTQQNGTNQPPYSPATKTIHLKKSSAEVFCVSH